MPMALSDSSLLLSPEADQGYFRLRPDAIPANQLADHSCMIIGEDSHHGMQF